MQPYSFAAKQLIVNIFGIFLALFIYKTFNYKYLSDKRFCWGTYAIANILLLSVLVFGRVVNNAKSWIVVGGLSIQPAELAKVLIILFVASYIKRKWYEIENNFYTYVSFVLISFVPVILILLERDLGSATILAAIIFAMIFVTGLSFRYTVIPLTLGSILFTIGIAIAPYRVARIKMLLSPMKYYHTAGKYSSYQLVQSFIAFAKGGTLGTGIAQGKQQMFFLPFPFSDFIYAHIAEETGIIGALIVVLAFLLILYIGLAIADKSDEKLGKYLSLGLTLYIFLQAMVHIGVNIGVVPTTGITLPFISMGGSSLISMYISIGLLMGIAKKMPKTGRTFYTKLQQGKYA